MLDATTYRRLAEEATEAVMVRTILEHALEPEAVDAVFETCREDQYTRTLLFSSVVGLMTLVVCRVRRSVSAAYQLQKEKLAVSLKSLYNKLNASDVAVCEGLFAHAAGQMRAVMQELGIKKRPLIAGYEVRILDGNQWAATEHRLKELRTISAGPLPGKALVVWDADWGMIRNVYCCEDSYTQERKMALRVLDDVQSGELWIADRNFCTAVILWQLQCMNASFAIRRHSRNVRFHTAGSEAQMAESETGVVYETPIAIEDVDGNTFAARLIRIELEEKTRDGDTSLEILSNLPASVSALQIADAYRERWQIETAFFELDRVFEGEIKTLAHPGAAMLAFSLSLIAYNALCVSRAAIGSAHGEEAVEQFSDYYFTEIVSADWRALDIFATPLEWIERFRGATPETVATELKRLAKQVDLRRIKKSTRGPKKKPPQRIQNKRKPHISTHRVLQARKQVE